MNSFEKLSSLCSVITDGSHYSPVSVEKGIPMLSVKDMTNLGFNYDNCNYITNGEYEKMLQNGCVPQVNDVLIAKDGSYLKHVFVVEKAVDQAILSSIGILRPNCKLIDPYYLKYYLSSDFVKKQVAKKYVSGSALPRIILKNFKDIDIPMIELNEQKKISSVLKNIDDKILNNNRIISELESMSKTVYDYWFLQFEFPNENGKPYKSSGGKMVWNEELKREIPEGWGVTNVGNITTCLDSKRVPLSSKDRESMKGPYPYYGATSEMDSVNEYLFDGDYVLLAEDGSVMDDNGFPILQRTSGKVWVNNHAHVLQPKEPYGCKLLMFILKNIPVSMIKTGSIQMKVNQENLNAFKVLSIPENIIEKANSILNPIDTKIIMLKQENQKLASLRDFLLPMLMNGQVTFKEEA